jgi:hypothetical protein
VSIVSIITSETLVCFNETTWRYIPEGYMFTQYPFFFLFIEKHWTSWTRFETQSRSALVFRNVPL